ncbi:hypothetical protein DMC47_10935 [Nostoc sp. 3335mG]|nr:hypothetical protein DMC47_10935 [Nostoc sp. 3335mG]
MIRWLFLSALSLGVGGQSGAPAQEPTKPDIVVVTGRVEDLRYDELDDVGLNFEVTATLRISRVASPTVRIKYITHGGLPKNADLRLRMRRADDGTYLVCSDGSRGYMCE